jgi:hypothetical protein
VAWRGMVGGHSAVPSSPRTRVEGRAPRSLSPVFGGHGLRGGADDGSAVVDGIPSRSAKFRSGMSRPHLLAQDLRLSRVTRVRRSSSAYRQLGSPIGSRCRGGFTM